jgi:hypothetical protein
MGVTKTEIFTEEQNSLAIMLKALAANHFSAFKRTEKRGINPGND